jgi:Ca-activated chloride channel family protein
MMSIDLTFWNPWRDFLSFPFHPMLLVVVAFFVTLPFWAYSYLRGASQRRKQATLLYSSFENFRSIAPSFKIFWRHLPFFCRFLALFLLLIGLARPQKGEIGAEIQTEGINILLALDRSSSMLARDFTLEGKQTDRLEAVKRVVQGFIKKRQTDAIGLLVFAGYADLQCPLTLDYNILDSLVSQLSIVTQNSEDGTAIGDAIGLAVLRLKEIQAKSKILILLTDGENTAGALPPLQAAELAKQQGIRIFTIGAGTEGEAPFPAMGPFGREILVSRPVTIDEKTLREIARITDGKYFRATDTEKLEEIYGIIDQMIKTKHSRKIFTEYSEQFHYFVYVALVLLLLEVFLANTFLRKLP